MKLSIVIPAYNVEQYVGRCLDSIFNQQIETDMLEVIVVNDGSKDRTEDIIKNYAAQYPNLIYISQENQGQSVARNTGLKRATGDLVWYVDSDDATTENSIKTIFYYFEKYPNADFLTFDRIHYNLEDGTKKYCKSWGGRKAPENTYEKPLDGKMANKYLVASVPWFHVFKRLFLINNNLFFTPNLINEDDEICMRLFFFAKEVRYIPFAHYIYTAMRPGSLTTADYSKTTRKKIESMKIVSLWEKFEKNYAKSKKDHQYINASIHYKYAAMLLTNYNVKEFQGIFKQYKKVWKKKLTYTYFKSTTISNFSLAKLIRFICALWFPSLYKYTKLS